MEKPKRRFDAEITIGADTQEDFISELTSLLIHLESKISLIPTEYVSGGCGSNATCVIVERPEMTRNKYFEQLEEYRKESL